MRLLSLNIWGGIVYEPLMKYIEKASEDVDIFCFQEMFHNVDGTPSVLPWKKKVQLNIFSHIETILPNFQGYYAPTQDNEESLTMFVKKDISVDTISDIFVYRWKNAMIDADASTFGVNMQYLIFHKGNKPCIICNLHGHWTPGYKGDNPARMEQSENIMKFLNTFEYPKILCGDFNMRPDIKSMALLENGMKNLIKEHKITSTRSSLYSGEEKFADYILVSPDIKIIDFKVDAAEVSDHLPLILEFDF